MRRARGRPPHDDILTPAEWRTVDAVRHGLTNREIAERRGISIDAVKFHVANAIAKLGLENRRALRFWSGAARESPLSTRSDDRRDGRLQQQGSEDVSNGPLVSGIGQIARSVADIAEAERWYRDVLGLEHLFTFDTLAFFDCGGTRLMLSQGEEVQPHESIVYLRVADIEAAHAELASRGVEFVSAPHMIHRHEDGTEEWMAFFKDPEGRPIAIMASVAA